MGGEVWFHGSPSRLTEIRPGSTITRDRTLALVFSHRPTLVSDERNEGGLLRHNGRHDGWLHVLADSIGKEDITPVPGSTLGAGQEFLVTRSVRVTAIERTMAGLAELLSADEEVVLRQGAEASRS